VCSRFLIKTWLISFITSRYFFFLLLYLLSFRFWQLFPGRVVWDTVASCLIRIGVFYLSFCEALVPPLVPLFPSCLPRRCLWRQLRIDQDFWRFIAGLAKKSQSSLMCSNGIPVDYIRFLSRLFLSLSLSLSLSVSLSVCFVGSFFFEFSVSSFLVSSTASKKSFRCNNWMNPSPWIPAARRGEKRIAMESCGRVSFTCAAIITYVFVSQCDPVHILKGSLKDS